MFFHVHVPIKLCICHTNRQKSYLSVHSQIYALSSPSKLNISMSQCDIWRLLYFYGISNCSLSSKRLFTDRQ